MRYIMEHECAAEVFCREHGITPPTIRHMDDLVHEVGLSLNLVERGFNKLDPIQRKYVLATSDIEPEDCLVDADRAIKLAQFTLAGRLKIADGMKLIRSISRVLPPVATRRQFAQIDEELKHGH